MKTPELIYHFAIIAMSLIIFFMKVTAPNAFAQFLFRIVAKVGSLFCAIYATIQIFKYFGVL